MPGSYQCAFTTEIDTMTNRADIEARKLLNALEEAWNSNYALNKVLRDEDPHSQIRVDLANMKGEMET